MYFIKNYCSNNHYLFSKLSYFNVECFRYNNQHKILVLLTQNQLYEFVIRNRFRLDFYYIPTKCINRFFDLNRFEFFSTDSTLRTINWRKIITPFDRFDSFDTSDRFALYHRPNYILHRFVCTEPRSQ